jgi:hypothetical protein
MAAQSINLLGGKYTVVVDPGAGIYRAERYREPWRDLTGDKLVLAMFDEIVDLRAELASKGG